MGRRTRWSFCAGIGLLLSEPLHEVVQLLPQPIPGAILLFEALALLSFVRDQAAVPRDLSNALLVGVVAVTLPYGFVVGLVLGLVVHHGFRRFGTVRDDLDADPTASQEGLPTLLVILLTAETLRGRIRGHGPRTTVLTSSTEHRRKSPGRRAGSPFRLTPGAR